MPLSDWLERIVLIVGPLCWSAIAVGVAVLVYLAGKDVGFKRGWIAGIDYERQRMKEDL